MSRGLYKTFCKLLQRQTYTCLSSRYGIWLCIGGVLLTLISAFQFGEVVIEWSMQQYSTTYNIYHDNIAGKSFQDRLCLPVPIDIVYTWVNGSDPKLIADLEKLKLELELKENKTKLELDKNLSANDSTAARKHLEKAISSISKKKRGEYSKKQNAGSKGCQYTNCVPGKLLIFETILQGYDNSLRSIHQIHSSFAGITRIQNATLLKSGNKITIMYFPSADSAINALKANVKWNKDKLTGHLGYFTTDSSLPSTIESESELLVTGFKAYTDLARLQEVLQEQFDKEFLDIEYNSDKHVAAVYFSSRNPAKRALDLYKGNFSVDGRSLQFLSAFIAWSISTTVNPQKMQKNSSYSDDENADISANRFADNQELKYSLRSVEKYTPWIRNIYIVTNGQIPSWLNLDNPRVKLITHEEIFLNKSYLPTFSSPAIESNIFRIPGLSNKFIYMNDDVMFGDEVWPDDFYTHANGQKFYLTWPVPNCNDGCPASWVNDKYCDKACNVSECDWDGGDCIGVTKKGHYAFQNWHNQQSRFKFDFCSTGCADTWVGDRYCDTACNVLNCGYDAGDCGTLSFDKLHSEDVLKTNQVFHPPNGLSSMYFNISRIFRGKITGADHSQERIIRTAIVAQKHKTLTLTFRGNLTLTTVSFRIAGFADVNDTVKAEVSFNITLDTHKAAKPTSQAKTTLSSIVDTTSQPTIPTVGPVPKTLYPIYISDSDKSVNYWNVRNSSFPRPTWPTINTSEYSVPDISNDTVLPDEVQHSLDELSEEFKAGDLTLKGFGRKKAKILKKFLSTLDKHDVTATIGIPSSNSTHTDRVTSRKVEEGVTDAEDHEGNVREEERGDHQTKHARRLLSIIIRDDFEENREVFGSTTEPYLGKIGQRLEETPAEHVGPTKDELFLADWIANSKRKQLSRHQDIKEDSLKWKQRYGDWNPQSRASEMSFLPWERLGVFKRSQKLKECREKIQDYQLHSAPPKRKLLDTFADSLLHVHRIYNRKFGYGARKVPAHMPHMIDVSVMRELQEMFPGEFDATSSHKLRSSDDMQFAFSYMYYVMGQKTSLNVTALFAELDIDQSGALSDRELRTLATRLYPLPLEFATIKSLERTLINCSLASNKSAPLSPTSQLPTEKYYEHALPLVTESLLRACAPIMDLLNDTKKTLNKYKYETTNDDTVAFKMIRDNATVVLNQMDQIRAKKKKFICLNDNLDHGGDTKLVKGLLVDLYETLFPVPSQFELRGGYRNRFLYVDELHEWRRKLETTRYRNNVVLLVSALLVLVFFFRWRIVRLVRRLCPFRRRCIFNAGESTRLRSV